MGLSPLALHSAGEPGVPGLAGTSWQDVLVPTGRSCVWLQCICAAGAGRPSQPCCICGRCRCSCTGLRWLKGRRYLWSVLLYGLAVVISVWLQIQMRYRPSYSLLLTSGTLQKTIYIYIYVYIVEHLKIYYNIV